MKKNKAWNIILIISSVLMILSSTYLIINLIKLANIENNLRLLGGIIIVIITLLYLMICLKRINIYSKIKNIILLIFCILYIVISNFINYNFQIIYSKLSNVTDNYKTSTLCLVTMKSNKVDNISDIVTGKIGILGNKANENTVKLAKSILKDENITNTLREYSDYLSIVKDLYEGTIKYAFMPDSYGSIFINFDGYKDVESKTKIIFKKDEKIELSSSTKSIKEPFTVLLMGVDTLETSYNADTLLVVTFNPNTLSSSILSIPRDTYTKIACTGGKHKINSSGWYGDYCVVDTVSDYLDVDIDYYAKVNFTGIVELVNAVGGIDVDVPYTFCEQNSKRQFGSNTIYLEKGYQTLNGEQALALSRNRHGWPQYCPAKYNTDGERSDFTRGKNQQLVLKALLNKIKSVRNVNTFYDLLDTLGNNIETNMDNNTILSFYNIAKDVLIKSKDVPFEEIINMQRLFFTSYTPTVRISGLPLSMVVNYDSSLKAIQKAMKQNLGLIKKDKDLSFSFNINNPYVENVIGTNLYDSTKIQTLPDFTGQSFTSVINYANEHGYAYTVQYKDVTDGSYKDGIIISQSPESYTDLATINKTKGLTVVAAKVTTGTSISYELCKDEKNKDDSKCLIPNWVNKTYTEFTTWVNNVNKTLKFNPIPIPTTDNSKDNNIITKQDGATSLYDLYKDTKKLTITYNVKTSVETEEPVIISTEE